MESKIHSVVITSILAFVLIAGVIPAAFVNVLAQENGVGDTGGMTGGEFGEDTGGITEDLGNDTGGITEDLGNDTGGMTGGELGGEDTGIGGGLE